jgi:hypothetical protein
MRGVEQNLKMITEEDKKSYFSWPDTYITFSTINIVLWIATTTRQDDGLFMLKFVECWNGSWITKIFTQSLIDDFRQKIVALLINSSINEYKEATPKKLLD